MYVFWLNCLVTAISTALLFSMLFGLITTVNMSDIPGPPALVLIYLIAIVWASACLIPVFVLHWSLSLKLISTDFTYLAA